MGVRRGERYELGNFLFADGKPNGRSCIRILVHCFSITIKRFCVGLSAFIAERVEDIQKLISHEFALHFFVSNSLHDKLLLKE